MENLEHKSYSEISSIIDADDELGKKYIISNIISYHERKKEIEELEKELDSKILAQDSLINSIEYICKHLKLNVPLSISHKNNMYIIDNDYRVSIIKSDYSI